MNPERRRALSSMLALTGAAYSGNLLADLPDTIGRVRKSIVAVGTYQVSRNPALRTMGTGFSVGDGTVIVTNAHVVSSVLDAEQTESWVIAQTMEGRAVGREVKKIAVDVDHDIALLKLLGGPPIPPLRLAEAEKVREGQTIAIAGFPIGEVLGLFMVTHRGIISAISPVGIPSARADQLDPKLVRQLSKGSFDIFQLDVTAYPGNSGSPVFDPDSGEVLGIVNSGRVRGTRESALSSPTAITYAIPARHLRELLRSGTLAQS